MNKKQLFHHHSLVAYMIYRDVYKEEWKPVAQTKNPDQLSQVISDITARGGCVKWIGGTLMFQY